MEATGNKKILVSNAKSPPTSCRKGYFDQSCIWTWIKPNPGNLYLGISLVPCCWSCIWFRINICNGCKGNKSTVPRDCSWPASISQSNCQKLVEFMRLLPQCSGMESHWMLCLNKPCTNTNRKIQCSSALGIWNQMGSNRNTAHHPSLPSHKVMSDRVCSTKRPYMVTCGHTSNWHLKTSCWTMRWISQIVKSLPKGKTQRTAKGIVTSSPTQETTSFCGNHSEGNHIHKSRHTETCDNITSKGMVGRSGNMKATSTEILLECQGFTHRKIIIYTFFAQYAEQSLLEWLLFTMGYCYRLSPKQSHTRVVLHAAVSHQILSSEMCLLSIRYSTALNQTLCSNFPLKWHRHLYSPAIASIMQHKAHDCRPNTDLTASGLLSIATNYPWTPHTGSFPALKQQSLAIHAQSNLTCVQTV